MTATKFEDQLNILDKEIEEIKALKIALDENNQRFEKLLEKMEYQLQLREQSKTKTINNGELLSTHGIMSQAKQMADSCETKRGYIENGEEINSQSATISEDLTRSFTIA
jgi:hypothetical protein